MNLILNGYSSTSGKKKGGEQYPSRLNNDLRLVIDDQLKWEMGELQQGVDGSEFATIGLRLGW